MIDYKTFSSERINEVYQIYRENQWSEYLSDKNKLSRAFYQSLGFSKDLNGYPINHYFRSQPTD
ncbi:hypothetical protein [Streptococcus sp. CSL10205-OR2]|uniref:hypothetical protein n=1 Tax=Streptococcus sp. CSL10205-OR2 TaxID=2980558 RepID=UPI0021DA6353|nr:hypothetical protein [Streptococcus sp. CSL10205-OR2]MCU9534267.1 hypothetical protein [Streptococcus sp. CSL10205-OR2]